MYKKIFYILLFFILFSTSYSQMVKRVHFDNMKTQLGYKNTISENDFQTMTMLDDRILSIYKENGLYCLGTTKLVATSSGFFSNCFENENSLGMKVSNIYIGKKHQNIFLIADTKIASYKISPITFKIKYRVSLENL